ncbi:hypothetical protein PHYPSEUDO_002734 [Phytophthora pseudosyringae]|uniref:Kinesin motor domain-containing protein n=1 Tax=Phytophthora pseudosyringae TaxID=221518 RepID=A0A8T1WFS4_9STRA|nr:hypothetical protein PHYPSEUDO_002734 [Phytophthora pseudosyringae]
MVGSIGDFSRGIIPRAEEQVMKTNQELEHQGWTYFIEVSAVQVYNEQVSDLFHPSGDKGVSIHLRNNKVSIPGLTQVPVNSSGEVNKLLQQAMRGRKTASTAMNTSSSRSHCVFTLHLVGSNPAHGDMLCGQLKVVDLAGSGRIARSKVKGNDHIPFRRSKLTSLLKDSFLTGGKVQMIVNVSSDRESALETLQSLRFATMANACALGTPNRRAIPKRSKK